MLYLNSLRFIGFTVCGFWIPLIFWVSVITYHCLKSCHKKDLLLMLLFCASFSFLTAVQTVSNSAYSVQMYAMSILFTGFLIMGRFGISFSILEVGAIAWLSAFFTDLCAASLVNNPTVLPHGITLLSLDVVRQFTLNAPFYWHTVQAIGGAGLTDGLVLLPLEVMLQVFVIRKFMEAKSRVRIQKQVVI